MGRFKKILKALNLKKEKRTILIVGLNNSGKTTIIQHLKNPTNQTATISVPTVGFNMEQFQSEGISFSVFDLSGAMRYRNLWDVHFKNCHGIIFCIDSTDKMRLIVVKDELNIFVQHPHLKKRSVPILFYSNKTDCSDSLSEGKIAAALELENIKGIPWFMSSSNALTGEGLEEGIQWLIQNMRFSAITKESNKYNKNFD